MISISRLLCGEIGPGDHLRYGKNDDPAARATQRPIVVWNCTRLCNLKCAHCYADALPADSDSEMTTSEARRFIDHLASFGVPVLLFSGGEPMARKDFLALSKYATGRGLGVVVSTNGTLIDSAMADSLGEVGFREIGISLDGVGEVNDRFRGKAGAFDSALRGIRECVARGQRVSLRMTCTRANHQEVPRVLDLVEQEGVDRVCFYHLAYSGRGNDLRDADLTHKQTRALVDLICDRTIDFYRRGLRKEILTVGNHVDGIYLYLRLKVTAPERAENAMELLRRNGGNSSGIFIGAVDEKGDVHPDQFWRSVTLGNVRERAFGDIWTDTSNPIMAGLKDRRALLRGRCAGCSYVSLCNGNLRARAEAVHGDIWQQDPACYLTDEEVGIAA